MHPSVATNGSRPDTCGNFNYEEMQQLEKDTVRLRERRHEQRREGEMRVHERIVLLIIMLTSLPHTPDDKLAGG
jgi:hypothetical protein